MKDQCDKLRSGVLLITVIANLTLSLEGDEREATGFLKIPKQ